MTVECFAVTSLADFSADTSFHLWHQTNNHTYVIGARSEKKCQHFNHQVMSQQAFNRDVLIQPVYTH